MFQTRVRRLRSVVIQRLPPWSGRPVNLEVAAVAAHATAEAARVGVTEFPSLTYDLPKTGQDAVPSSCNQYALHRPHTGNRKSRVGGCHDGNVLPVHRGGNYHPRI